MVPQTFDLNKHLENILGDNFNFKQTNPRKTGRKGSLDSPLGIQKIGEINNKNVFI